MKLRKADIEKAYSEQLENLLQQGYELVGEKELEYLGDDKINPEIAILKKDGKCFELAFWVSLLSQETVKWTMALTDYDKSRWLYHYRGVENQLENPFVYYEYSPKPKDKAIKREDCIFSTESEGIQFARSRMQ
jgi:hypothetical protein